MKLSPQAKAAFLRRMATGRRKAATKKNPHRPRTKKTATAKKPVAKKAAPKKKKAKRRLNPEEMAEAEELYLQFHQRPANRIIEYDDAHEFRSELAELGRLIELRFDLDPENEAVPLKKFGATQVACTPDGANIYFIGGDMTLDLEALGIAEKDYVELGPCTYISYHTQKGFHDFDPVIYEHDFGEEDGILPVLMYDQVNKALYLASGNYTVLPAGITN